MAGERAVLDTSVLASALVSPHGEGNALLHHARLQRYQLVVSTHILAEVRQTLIDAFRVEPADAEELIRFVRRIAEVLEPATVPLRSRDPDDDPVLALADECGAVFLATYDHDLMAVKSVGSCGIVHPATALQVGHHPSVSRRPLACP